MTAEPAPRVQVVRLGEEQGDTVAALLGRAFQDDPLFAHACPDPTERARWLPWMFRWDAWRGFLSGEMLGTSGRLDGAAVAVRPGVSPFTDADLASFDYERGRQIVGPEIWDRASVALTAALEPPEEALHEAVPEPHWYLDIIAVEPRKDAESVAPCSMRSRPWPMPMGCPLHCSLTIRRRGTSTSAMGTRWCSRRPGRARCAGRACDMTRAEHHRRSRRTREDLAPPCHFSSAGCCIGACVCHGRF